MNWNSVTNTESVNAWYLSEIIKFPNGHSELFAGFAIAHLQEKIIFTGAYLPLFFWAVAKQDKVTSATVQIAGSTTKLTNLPQASMHLPPQFPDLPYTQQNSFAFLLDLDSQAEHVSLEIYIEVLQETVHIATLQLVNRRIDGLQANEIKMAHQIPFLRQWSKNKAEMNVVASTCSHLISLCKEQTPAGIYAILGDTLEAKKQFSDAIAAYRKAVELQPQESKFEMRLSQLLQEHAPDEKALSSTPKGISLSTSGDTALTIIVDMLYRSTPSYMYVRELFQNELDAIYRRWDKEVESQGQSSFTGTISVEPDSNNPQKLCFWGDGIGMTFDQVTNHLAKLVNSGNVAHNTKNPGEPSSPSNFGIGAKTSALPENTKGMVYRTLPFGEKEGIEFTLWKNPSTFLYEIKGKTVNGETEYFRKVPMSEFNDTIKNSGSGSYATLLGNSDDEDTFKKSASLLNRQIAGEQVNKGIGYFLNSRYFTLPAAGLKVQVAEYDANEKLIQQNIIGQQAFLMKFAEKHGCVTLKAMGLEVKAHWWLLSEAALSQADSFNALGHVGLLWKNELYYNPNEAQRVQRLQLNGFGIHYGEERVVIYIEPSKPNQVDSHPSRTRLMFKQRDLNAVDFGQQFANNMPAELDAYQKSFLSVDATADAIDQIKNNLKHLGLTSEAKMRQYALALKNRGKPQTAANPQKREENAATETKAVQSELDALIPNCVWRDFDPEAALYAAEWDSKGYAIKFNSAWLPYQKALAALTEETKSQYLKYPAAFISKECQKQLRYEYYKIVVETLFSAYSMIDYANWTDRMIETQLLSPAALSAVLQYNSNMRSNAKAALSNSL
ncbi:hypothetical protein JCM14076_17400 [Methylosoma difficile]